MDISRLKLFVALAETLHFHRASRRCHVSASTLSRNIAQLEEAVGSTLFLRDNKSVELTRAGERFLDYARDSLQQWETLRESLHDESAPLSGELSVFCSVTASYSFLHDLLLRFRGQHPAIEIKLHTGDPALAIDRVLGGEEDIAITAKPDKLSPQLEFKRFTTSPLVVIAPLDDEIFLQQLTEHPRDFWSQVPMILSERGLARERINRWFQRKRVTPNIYAQVAGNEAIVSMVSLGFGIGLLPQIVADNSPLAGSVKLFAEQPKLKAYEVGVCVLKKRLKSPLVRAFWELLGER